MYSANGLRHNPAGAAPSTTSTPLPREIANPIELLALALPFVALATVMLFALRKRTRAQPEIPVLPTASHSPEPDEPEPLPKSRRRALAAVSASPDELQPAGATTAQLATRDAPVARSPATAAELLDAIRAAVVAKDSLRHAAARVTLGDVLQASGDLTTACEHWQIARAIYHETGLATELEGVEVRMRRNGCPTDWVLNDF